MTKKKGQEEETEQEKEKEEEEDEKQMNEEDDEQLVEAAIRLKELGNKAYLAAGDNEDRLLLAMNFYIGALVLEPPDAVLLPLRNNLAAVFLKLGDPERAWQCCEEALDIDPVNEKALFRGAKACHALGRYVKAANLCDRGLKVNPAHKDLLALQKELIVLYANKTF